MLRSALAVLASAALVACSAPVTPPAGPSLPPAATPPTAGASVGPGGFAAPAERPRNLILFIADGFGPASATMGRAAKGAPLAFDSLLTGAVETSATDSRVTDSAASATAYACGVKTYNGAIGVTPDGAPCVTILERAEAAGMSTGLVATSRITHATPAAFAAHVPRRSQEAEIAEQMLASGVDVLLGGGAGRFADRDDGRDLLAAAAADGWTVATDRAGYDALSALPAAGLLAPSHLAYEVDRDAAAEPSLAEMTRRALRLLDAHAGEAGFFVMIEASRIDHAGHANDPAGHLHDILAYDAAVAEALAWAAADGETLVVATADHETGGMSLGAGGVYAWDPAPLLAATASFDAMTARLVEGDDPAAVVSEGLAVPLGPAEADALREAVAADSLVGRELSYLPGSTATSALLRRLASEAANVGWTTGGHTAVDVGLYAYGPGAHRLRGAMPNDALGRRLRAILLGE